MMAFCGEVRILTTFRRDGGLQEMIVEVYERTGAVALAHMAEGMLMINPVGRRVAHRDVIFVAAANRDTQVDPVLSPVSPWISRGTLVRLWGGCWVVKGERDPRSDRIPNHWLECVIGTSSSLPPPTTPPRCRYKTAPAAIAPE